MFPKFSGIANRDAQTGFMPMGQIEITGNVYYGDAQGKSTGKPVLGSAMVGHACYTACPSWSNSHVTSTDPVNGRYAITFTVADDGRSHVLSAVIPGDTTGYRASESVVVSDAYKNLKLDFVLPKR